MSLAVLAAHLLGARTMRRLIGCGCLAMVAMVALPILVLVAAVRGIIPGGDAANQVDAAAGVVIGAAEPLAPGHFRVSQGFGCTALAAEPPPPRGYACPPDAGHAGAVRFHTGIDLAAPAGLPVFAVVDGTVRVIDSRGGFGLHVLLMPSLQGSPPLVYLYGHLRDVTVVDGESVRAGETIGSVGSSGNSTGPHLHFEVEVGGIPVNPCSTFPPGYLVPAGVAAAGCLAWAM